MLTPTHAKDEIEELPQWRSGSVASVLLPATTPVRPVLSTGQTGDDLRACLWLILLSSSLFKYFFLMARCLLYSRRRKPWVLARIELQWLVCHIFGKLRLCNLFNHIHDIRTVVANVFGVLG
jgi:hypothetical protein